MFVVGCESMTSRTRLSSFKFDANLGTPLHAYRALLHSSVPQTGRPGRRKELILNWQLCNRTASAISRGGSRKKNLCWVLESAGQGLIRQRQTSSTSLRGRRNSYSQWNSNKTQVLRCVLVVGVCYCLTTATYLAYVTYRGPDGGPIVSICECFKRLLLRNAWSA